MKNYLLITSLLLTISVNTFAGDSFFYYTKAHRLMSLERLYEATKSRYSLWDIKLLNMEISGDEIFQNAIAFEETIGEVQGSVARAKSNFEFHDRVSKLIAGFKDTHFKASENTRLPNITSGLRTEVITENGVRSAIVTAISKKLMKFNAELGHNSYKKIKNGDIILSIDGIETSEYMKNLRPYIAGSSEAFIDSRAAQYLSRRNMLYPQKNYSDWVFRSSSSQKKYRVRLPWYVDKSSRKDVQTYFKAKNFRVLDERYFSWDDKLLKWDENRKLNYSGYDIFAKPVELEEEQEWRDEDKKYSDVRTGIIRRNGKEYGYFQLFSFNSSELHKFPEEDFVDEVDEEEGYDSKKINNIFVDFIVSLKKRKLPLIFDLRVNFGGSTSIAIENLSALAKIGDEYPSRTTSYRVTDYMSAVFNEENRAPENNILPNYWDRDFFAQEYFHALSIGEKYTNVLLQTEPIKAHDEVEGYNEKVVALVTPWCISACDNQAFLLKASKRALLIGTEANGTGAGFLSSSKVGVSFVDPLFIIKARIPNYLFGYPLDSERRSIPDPDMSLLLKTNSENKPVKADINFDNSKKSYLNQGRGWIEKAILELNK